jgi:uncharacterized protein YbjT (DUF2867 family)
MKRAIVFGSSGFVGSNLLSGLLNSSDYGEVTAVARRSLNITHPKLRTVIADYDSLVAGYRSLADYNCSKDVKADVKEGVKSEIVPVPDVEDGVKAEIGPLGNVKSDIAGDEVFIALGTTRASSPNEADYYRVDHDYPVLAARIAKEGGARSVFLVSAVDANPDSKMFYVRTKGDTERDVAALNFEHTNIFRPSMILGSRKERRSLLEDALMKFWPAINPLLAWKGGKYRGMTGEDIAKAMIETAKNQTKRNKIYEWREMQDLVQGAAV